MNAVVNTPAAPQAMKSNQAVVIGKVESKRKHDKFTYTVVLLAAPDPYTRPDVLEVRSRQSIGDVGEQVKCLVTLGGFKRKPFQTEDGRTVQTVSVMLDAVE